jgi:hypothetical protein
MINNEVFGGILLIILGVVFMSLHKFLSNNVNLQFIYHKAPLMTPESSYGKKWGRIYVFILGLIFLLIGIAILILGLLNI